MFLLSAKELDEGHMDGGDRLCLVAVPEVSNGVFIDVDLGASVEAVFLFGLGVAFLKVQ